MSEIVRSEKTGRAVWRATRRVVLVDGRERELRADQCWHAWASSCDAGEGERCLLCGATCRRGEGGKIEIYAAAGEASRDERGGERCAR